MITNHCGVTVDSEVPTTGVLTNWKVTWLEDDLYSLGIDVYFEEHLETCENDCHDECWGESDGSLFLIGFKKNADGKYEEDPDKEYSAIVNTDSGYSQVTKSIYAVRCNLCSPCYPGQGDVDSEGDFLAYSFPPDMFDTEDEESKEFVARIFKI